MLLGNAVLHTAERAFEAFAAGFAPLLVIAGGIGHSTALLHQALAANPRYRDVLGPALPEAELLARVAVRHFGVDPARIVLETVSTIPAAWCEPGGSTRSVNLSVGGVSRGATPGECTADYS